MNPKQHEGLINGTEKILIFSIFYYIIGLLINLKDLFGYMVSSFFILVPLFIIYQSFKKEKDSFFLNIKFIFLLIFLFLFLSLSFANTFLSDYSSWGFGSDRTWSIFYINVIAFFAFVLYLIIFGLLGTITRIEQKLIKKNKREVKNDITIQ